MSRLPESFAISVDGYGAGPKQSVDNPLGVGGVALYEWAFATQTFQKMLGNAGGATGVDDDFAERGFSNVGAWIIGCNMFGPIRGDSRVRAQRLPFYWELGSVFKGRPSVDTNRRSGDSVDSFDAD